MGDPVRQKAIVSLLCDRGTGEANHFRSPGVGQRIRRQLDDVQHRRWQRAVQGCEVREFLNGCCRVSRSYALMRGLEVDVQFHTGFVALVFLKDASDDRAGKTWFIRNEGERLGGQNRSCSLLGRRNVGDGSLATSNYQHMRGQGNADGRGEAIQAVTADREPASGIKKIAGVIADGGEA